MKTLADYTRPTLMVAALRNHTAETVIAELCAALQLPGQLGKSTMFYDAVLARELLSPTTCVEGWALPHARIKGLPSLSFTLARSTQPVVWVGDPGVPVRTVFLFAVPEIETKTYLDVISAVAKLSRNPGLVEQLVRAEDAGAMFNVLKQVPLHQSRQRASSAVAPGPILSTTF